MKVRIEKVKVEIDEINEGMNEAEKMTMSYKQKSGQPALKEEEKSRFEDEMNKSFNKS